MLVTCWWKWRDGVSVLAVISIHHLANVVTNTVKEEEAEEAAGKKKKKKSPPHESTKRQHTI